MTVIETLIRDDRLPVASEGMPIGVQPDPSPSSEEVPTMPNPSIKDEEMYEELRRHGESKEKAARISNAAAARGKSAIGKKGGRPAPTTVGRCPN